MSKFLLRFCVYIYKGLLFIGNGFLSLSKKLFITDSKKDITKYKSIISEEKAKQKKIEEREALRLKNETLKHEKIDKQDGFKVSGKNSRVSRIEEKRRKKLERITNKEKKKKEKLIKAMNSNSKSSKPKKISERLRLKQEAKLAKMETQAKARIIKEKIEEEELKKSLETNKKNKKSRREQLKSDSVTIKQLTFADKINNFVKNIKGIPKRTAKFFRDKWANTSFAKYKKNKLD